MPLLLALPFLLLIALAVGAGVYAGIVIAKIARATKRFPTLADRMDAPEPEAGWPALVIVIPAHNEADVIADVARTVLKADYPNLHAVFALDRCTDATQAILQSTIEAHPSPNTAEIIPITHCPEGWAGKVHALHHAVRMSQAVARAEALLFLDADCQLDPACLKAAITLWREHDLDLLSVLSSLIAEHWYEKVVQPIAAFELVRQYPITRVNADFNLPRDPHTGRLIGKRHAWPFANGQFILVRKSAYEALGGHECVKEEVLEDIAIAKKFARARFRVGVFLSGGPLRCRMYRTWPAFNKGWKRIYTEAAKRRPNRLASNLRAVLVTKAIFPIVGPACALAAIPAAILRDWPLTIACASVGVLASSLYQRMIAIEFRAQGLPMPMPWTIMRGGWHVSRILRDAMRDLVAGNPTEWGGKQYHRPLNLDQTRAARAHDEDDHETHPAEPGP